MTSESPESLHLNLPASTRDFAQEQAAASDFSSISDYVASLIQGERRRKARVELKACR